MIKLELNILRTLCPYTKKANISKKTILSLKRLLYSEY